MDFLKKSFDFGGEVLKSFLQKVQGSRKFMITQELIVILVFSIIWIPLIIPKDSIGMVFSIVIPAEAGLLTIVCKDWFKANMLETEKELSQEPKP